MTPRISLCLDTHLISTVRSGVLAEKRVNTVVDVPKGHSRCVVPTCHVELEEEDYERAGKR